MLLSESGLGSKAAELLIESMVKSIMGMEESDTLAGAGSIPLLVLAKSVKSMSSKEATLESMRSLWGAGSDFRKEHRSEPCSCCACRGNILDCV